MQSVVPECLGNCGKKTRAKDGWCPNCKKSKPKKKHKFNAVSCKFDGHLFQSKLERDCYKKLKTLLTRKEIIDLKLQQKFPLRSRTNKKIAIYIADFVCTLLDGTVVVVEAKGRETPIWRRSKKHFMADYAFPLVIITKLNLRETRSLVLSTVQKQFERSRSPCGNTKGNQIRTNVCSSL